MVRAGGGGDDEGVGRQPGLSTAISDVTTTYLSTAKRTQLIDEYMDCWWDTCSFSTEEASEQEAAEVRALLESMPNPQLHAEIKSTGWDIL